MVDKDKVIIGLIKEVYSIKILWREFETLFVRDDKNYVGIDSSAKFFFAKAVQPSLLYWIMLSVARLLDPVKSCGKDNLVLDILCDDMSMLGDLKESKEVKAVREWRNKFLSHNDLDLIMSSKNLHETHSICNGDIKTVIDKIEKLLTEACEKNQVQANFTLPEIYGSAKDLFNLLKKVS